MVSTIGGYELNGVLGEGMNGTVHRVKRLSDGKCFAMKPVSTVSREVYLLGKIDHPHVVRLIDVGPSSMVLELAEGGDLFDLLHEVGRFSVPDLKNMAQQMLSATEYLGERGIVHRDIKLENWVIVNKESLDLRLIDFGLSVETKGRRLSKRVGSSYYIAPEVLKGLYSIECDIWSVGVICYMLVTGQPPIPGGTDDEIFQNILHRQVVFSSYIWENLSLRSFVSGLLQKSPSGRMTAGEGMKHPFICNK